MKGLEERVDWLCRFVYRRFLWLVLGAYGVAAAWPRLGSHARQMTVAWLPLIQESVGVSLPMLLLAALLFVAGLDAPVRQMWEVIRRPQVLFAAVLANLLVPIGFLLVLSQPSRLWHNPNETRDLLMGLGIVAAMPVAGSSAAWSQTAQGNAALSLGLVVVSTFLSPLTTPLMLMAIESMAAGDDGEVVRGLGGQHTEAFLVICVAAPSLAGLAVRRLFEKNISPRFQRKLKFGAALVLLFLCYSNASAALPEVVAQPDWDFLVVVLAVVVALCILAFAAGSLLARVLGVDESQRRSLMFGLAMNNNGAGMVLACASPARFSSVILPVLVYNLVQHIVAGWVNGHLAKRAGGAERRG